MVYVQVHRRCLLIKSLFHLEQWQSISAILHAVSDSSQLILIRIDKPRDGAPSKGCPRLSKTQHKEIFGPCNYLLGKVNLCNVI